MVGGMFELDKHNDGTIWITHPEPLDKNINRVASIERDDKGDVWLITINQGLFSWWFTLEISPENNEQKMVQVTKDIMLYSQFGVEYQ